MRRLIKRAATPVVLAACLLLGGCDHVSVYGSVGYSSYGLSAIDYKDNSRSLWT